MKIKMLVSRSGADGAVDAGQEIEVPDAEAIRMIEADQAVAIREQKPQRAVKKPTAEKATK